MKPLGRPFDARFRPHWVSYVFQSVLATIAVLAALLALRQQNLVVAASLAATAFTVFAMPSSVTSRARNVVGGHLVGLVFGCLFAIISAHTGWGRDGFYALAVGCSMFAMAITNTEHAPAAGTALGVVIAGFSLRVILGVVVGVAVLTVIHQVLRPFLRDLVASPED